MKLLNDVYAEEMKKHKSTYESLNWENNDVYAEWLAQTYCFVSYSTRIVALAGSLFNLERNELHLRFLDHAREERNHEKILITDLKAIQKDIKRFAPFAASAALFQTQFYQIQNVSPMSVYGYFLLLEGIAVEVGDDLYKRLINVYPANAINFVKVHANEDKEHIKEHFQFIEKCSEFEKKQIIENLQKSSGLYHMMMKEIKFKYSSSVQHAAA